MNPDYVLEDIKASFVVAIRMAGYGKIFGRWSNRKEGKMTIYSKKLNEIEGLRISLWRPDSNNHKPEQNAWEGMLSMEIGEEGDFPLGGIFFSRSYGTYQKAFPNIKYKVSFIDKNHDYGGRNPKIPKFEEMESIIEDLKSLIRSWDRNRIDYDKANEAMDKLATLFIDLKQPARARKVLRSSIKGEIYSATISEGLSIVQHKFSKTTHEKLKIALLWKQIFDPKLLVEER